MTHRNVEVVQQGLVAVSLTSPFKNSEQKRKRYFKLNVLTDGFISNAVPEKTLFTTLEYINGFTNKEGK